jgi:hypothetical protein
VGGRMLKVSPQVPYTPKAILVKKKKMMTTLSCYKKEREKKRRDREK